MSELTPSFGIPDRGQPLDMAGKVLFNEAWSRFLVRISQLTPERPLSPQAPGPSPWSYQATTIGHLMIVNTNPITSIQLTRGSDTILCPAVGGFIPMAALDTVTLTYPGAAPSVVFIPGARA